MNDLKMKQALWIDTSVKGASLAILGQSEASLEVLAVSHIHRAFGSAALLQKLTENLLDSQQTNLSNLDALIVSRGPGSFTGIKIGSAYTYGVSMGLSKKIPVFDVSPLLALAHYVRATQKETSAFLWLIPATRSEGYAVMAEQGQAPKLYAVDAIKELTFRDDAGKLFNLPLDFWQTGSIQTVLPWDLLENSHDLKDHFTHQKPFSYWAAECVEAVAWAWTNRFDLFRRTDRPDPLYLRQSSPQEKLRKEMRT